MISATAEKYFYNFVSFYCKNTVLAPLKYAIIRGAFFCVQKNGQKQQGRQGGNGFVPCSAGVVGKQPPRLQIVLGLGAVAAVRGQIALAKKSSVFHFKSVGLRAKQGAIGGKQKGAGCFATGGRFLAKKGACGCFRCKKSVNVCPVSCRLREEISALRLLPRYVFALCRLPFASPLCRLRNMHEIGIGRRQGNFPFRKDDKPLV